MRKRNTESLAEVIVQVLKSQRLDRPLNEKRLVDAWPVVLGTNIMNYTTGLYIKNRTLYVSLSSSVLRHDLFISREEIKNSLNKQVGVDVINDIVFK
jgi:predicted nucleic acid-binding Zn ribbon protein